jgi:quercetin dioxygenase-like cupin family protein
MSSKRSRPLLLLALVALACQSTPKTHVHSATAATTGVARADEGKGPRDARIITLRPLTGDVELLYGDPDVAGEPFVMRIRELPGTIVPPHSHPVDEHLTVVQGTWHFGFGDHFDTAALRELPTGGYAFAPKGAIMFGYADEAAVVQVHGIGPFHIRWQDGLVTLNDPQAPPTFRFKRDDRVAAPRGAGQVREGYASGTIVQYEIEGANGRFMALEQDLIRP